MTDRQNGNSDGQKTGWKSVVLSTTGTVLGLVSFFAVLTVMLANLYESDPPLAEGELPPTERIRKQASEDNRKLTTYEFIDRENGVWRIPIDVAIEKMIAENQTKRPDSK